MPFKNSLINKAKNLRNKTKRRSTGEVPSDAAEPIASNAVSVNNTAPIIDDTVETTTTTTERTLVNEVPISENTTVETVREPVDSSSAELEAREIPIPPPLPDVWCPPHNRVYPKSMENLNITRIQLPTQIIENPVIVHETIKEEKVEEIQPIVHIERLKTEVHQITQPLVDKEIKPVAVQERILPAEVLPTVTKETVSARYDDQLENTIVNAPSIRHVINKPPVIQEIEKIRIIDEIQPIIYKETIIPKIVRVAKPMREVIVESPIYNSQLYGQREISMMERQKYYEYYNNLSNQDRDFGRFSNNYYGNDSNFNFGSQKEFIQTSSTTKGDKFAFSRNRNYAPNSSDNIRPARAM